MKPGFGDPVAAPGSSVRRPFRIGDRCVAMDYLCPLSSHPCGEFVGPPPTKGPWLAFGRCRLRRAAPRIEGPYAMCRIEGLAYSSGCGSLRALF